MIIWINGPFGAGKTAVTEHLVQSRPNLVAFDPELLGAALRAPLQARKPVADFQDWAAWRRLVVAALIVVDAELSCDIAVPQSVLAQPYWSEISDGLAEHDLVLRGFTLDVAPVEHERRIVTDTVAAGAANWRLRRRDDVTAALPWLRTVTHVVDTTALSAAAVARTISRALDDGG